ncbi:alginate lyase family protein [Ciceribacter sp. T2.26MG-112.2]|uniref:alginate lyase family protein n=1 Tax=Ciceribacter sp. T2.26MG-112.2 TaxID=3137154 RepID=UPI0018A8F398|nr:alginate lyase family protein [Ciceribacter naphthalenivorans]
MNKGMNVLGFCAGLLLALADQADAFGAEDCKITMAPVVEIDLPSRYRDGDKSRSEIDEELDAAVDQALEPIDGFVRALAEAANRTGREKGAENAASCIFDGLADWAFANALLKPVSLNGRLALSSRIAGMAAAYNRARKVSAPDFRSERAILDWFARLADGQIAFFDNNAPPMAATNNHRAWAGLAATQVGIATGSTSLIDWGAETNRLMICSANDDGSLPQEMKRRDKALHYQLHAVAPIIMTASLLQPLKSDSFDLCNGKLDAIVSFTVTALDRPEVVAERSGATQTFATKKEKLRAFQIAWLEPYLANRSNKDAEALAAAYRPLSNSSLGGNLTAIYHQATP